MYFSSPLLAAMLMAMLPSALAAPAPESSIILGTPATEAEALQWSAQFNVATTTEDNLTKRSYINSCSDCGMGNPYTLVCFCNAGSNVWKWSTLDLNKCLVNKNGKLAWATNGGFKGSCNDNTALLGYQIFEAYCGPNYGRTTIDLNERIHNWSGVIGCSP